MLQAEDIRPLAGSCLPRIWEALAEGVNHADRLQPRAAERGQRFWAHSARYGARRNLAMVAKDADGWELVSGNSKFRDMRPASRKPHDLSPAVRRLRLAARKSDSNTGFNVIFNFRLIWAREGIDRRLWCLTG